MIRNAWVNSLKKAEPLVNKGIEFQNAHWKKSALGGMILGSAFGFQMTPNWESDYYLRQSTLCEKRVNIFENMYLGALLGGGLGLAPFSNIAAFTGAIGLAAVISSPMIFANILCEKSKK